MEILRLVKRTKSVCPVCLKQVDARVVEKEGSYFLRKTCEAHGRFSTIVWRGASPSYEEWTKDAQAFDEKGAANCPTACGLCENHIRKTCCVLVEITARCNLRCPVCFAMSGEQAACVEPTVRELSEQFKELAAVGSTFLQLSGGEPTVRDDLPEIVRAARDAGMTSIQLNSNGIRLGKDRAFTKALAEAGLSFVFMQFDGMNDEIYEKLRGAPLLEAKKAAIAACRDELIGVTLVPTVVPGLNDHNLGEIVNFAVKNSPTVRGVHFQPVSYFGRYPSPPRNEDRITIPEILQAVELQTDRKFKVRDFTTSCCDHPLCGFHGDFAVLPNNRVMRLSGGGTSSCCDDAHLKNRSFVARRWTRSPESEKESGDKADMTDMTTFLSRVKSHGFTITAMAFQDAYNLDIDRLRHCSLHVSSGGRIIPFCSNYITAVSDADVKSI